jgi:hypothetical protein
MGNILMVYFLINICIIDFYHYFSLIISESTLIRNKDLISFKRDPPDDLKTSQYN